MPTRAQLLVTGMSYWSHLLGTEAAISSGRKLRRGELTHRLKRA